MMDLFPIFSYSPMFLVTCEATFFWIVKQLKKHEWAADSKITIEITYGDAYGKTVRFDFVVSEYAAHWYGDKVVFKAQ